MPFGPARWYPACNGGWFGEAATYLIVGLGVGRYLDGQLDLFALAGRGAPRVNAEVTGSAVTLNVRCTVTYPAPVARVTEQARRHVINRIAEMTGLTTRQVDITVTALPATASSTRRKLQ